MSEQTPETQQESQADTTAPAAESSNGAVREVRWGPDDTSDVMTAEEVFEALDRGGFRKMSSDELDRLIEGCLVHVPVPTFEEAPAYWRKVICMDAYHSLRMSGINISLKKIKESRYAEWAADPDHPLNPNKTKTKRNSVSEQST